MMILTRHINSPYVFTKLKATIFCSDYLLQFDCPSLYSANCICGIPNVVILISGIRLFSRQKCDKDLI